MKVKILLKVQNLIIVKRTDLKGQEGENNYSSLWKRQKENDRITSYHPSLIWSREVKFLCTADQKGKMENKMHAYQ